MLLMIDNYDSFTYNVVQYLRELGANVDVHRNDEISLKEIEEMAPQKIVISPGPCTPNEAGISMQVVESFGKEIPILGICLGHQSIGQVFGGDVVRAREVMHGKTSPIFHNSKDLFKNVSQPFIATRYHSLIVDKKTLPDCLEVTAWTQFEDESQDEIMGFRHLELPIHGIQFHPESILTPVGHTLLQNFLDLAA